MMIDVHCHIVDALPADVAVIRDSSFVHQRILEPLMRKQEQQRITWSNNTPRVVGMHTLVAMAARPADLVRVAALVAAASNAASSNAARVPRIVAAYGIHPWFAHTCTDDDISDIEQRLRKDKTAIVGEIGLDAVATDPTTRGKYDFSTQTLRFHQQWSLAARLRRPVSIHAVRCHGTLVDFLMKTSSSSATMTTRKNSSQESHLLLSKSQLNRLQRKQRKLARATVSDVNINETAADAVELASSPRSGLPSASASEQFIRPASNETANETASASEQFIRPASNETANAIEQFIRPASNETASASEQSVTARAPASSSSGPRKEEEEEDNEDDEDPWPPAVMLHSYSGSIETIRHLKRSLPPHLHRRIYYSFSHVVNLAPRGGSCGWNNDNDSGSGRLEGGAATKKTMENMAAIEDDRILIESDLHHPDHIYEACYSAADAVAHAKKWKIGEAIEFTTRNALAFLGAGLRP